MKIPKNIFKANLLAGHLQIGLWSTLGSHIVAEVIGDSGFDWIALDTEHSPNELPNLVTQMQAIATGTASVMVRPAWNDPVLIKRILDIGAQTIIVPFVQNAEEAKSAVAATRYPPEGIRGVTGSGRAARYGRVKDYLHTASDEIAVVVQIETGSALEQIEAIAGVGGVDGVFIGPADLSASLGHIGNPNHETVQTALKLAVDKLLALNVPAGILAFNPDDIKRYIDWGYSFVAVGSDLSVLANGTQALAEKFRK